MKKNMIILMSVVAVIFLAVTMMSVAGDNNSLNTNAPAVNNAPSGTDYYCCNGPRGDYGSNGFRGGGGKGMFNGRRGMSGGWNCPGPSYQNAPQVNSGQNK